MPIDFTCPHCGARKSVADQYAGQTGPCANCGKTVAIPGWAGPVGTPSGGMSGCWIAAILLGVLGLVCGLPILIALLLPAVGAAREAARRTSCQNNLKQIALAMEQYIEVHGRFPPAYTTDASGRRLHSWRVLLLPYLEQGPLYRQVRLDEPWDSPHNRQFHKTVISLYHCPSDSSQVSDTSYVVVVGPGGVFEPGKQVTPESLIAGMSSTLMVVEASNSGIDWMEPRDLDMQELDFGINNSNGKGIRSKHGGGVNAAYCDGRVEMLDKDKHPPEKLRSMTSARGGIGGPDRPPW